MFKLADHQEINSLRDYCRDTVIVSLDLSNAANILFGYACNYADLKVGVLQYIANYADQLCSCGKDLFEAHKGHPQRYAVLLEVLSLKTKIVI